MTNLCWFNDKIEWQTFNVVIGKIEWQTFDGVCHFLKCLMLLNSFSGLIVSFAKWNSDVIILPPKNNFLNNEFLSITLKTFSRNLPGTVFLVLFFFLLFFLNGFITVYLTVDILFLRALTDPIFFVVSRSKILIRIGLFVYSEIGL